VKSLKHVLDVDRLEIGFVIALGGAVTFTFRVRDACVGSAMAGIVGVEMRMESGFTKIVMDMDIRYVCTLCSRGASTSLCLVR